VYLLRAEKRLNLLLKLTTQSNKIHKLYDEMKTLLEIWGKAKHESTRRRKSDWEKNSGGRG